MAKIGDAIIISIPHCPIDKAQAKELEMSSRNKYGIKLLIEQCGIQTMRKSLNWHWILPTFEHRLLQSLRLSQSRDCRKPIITRAIFPW